MKKKIIFGLVLCTLLSVMGIYPVNDVKAADSYTKEQITQYITDGEYPTEEGKVFAGWYNGETPVKSTSDVTDTTVPKFVDEDVLTVKFQLLAETTSTSPTTDVRFLTSVDSLNYQSVEFEVTLNQTVTTPVNKVYTSVNAEGEKFAPKEVFSEDSNYIATVLMKGFTKDAETEGDYGYWGNTITVTPKWTTMDGTTVTGKTRKLEVNDGLYDAEVNSGSTRTWHTLEDGFKTAVDSTEDVTLDILQDVSKTSMSQIAINDSTNKTITVNGGGHTLKLDGNTAHTFNVLKPYGKFAINDITIIHDETTTNGKQVFAFGSSGNYVSGTNLEVEFKGVTINSKSSNVYALINVQASQANTIKMTDTTITWNNANVAAADNWSAAVRMRPNVTKSDSLEMNNCTIYVDSPGCSGISIGSRNTGNVKLAKTTITTDGTSCVTMERVVNGAEIDSEKYSETECTLNNLGYGGLAKTIVGDEEKIHPSLYHAITKTMNTATNAVELELLVDVVSYDRYRLGTATSSNSNVTINGAGHTFIALYDGTSDDVLRMSTTNPLTFKDITIEHGGKSQLLRIGGATGGTTIGSKTLSLVMDNVDIHSTSTRKDTLINLHENQTFNVTMNDVHINWENSAIPDTNAAVIRFGIANQGKKVTLNMTNSSITSSTKGISGLYIPVGVLEGSAVTLDSTSITTAGETPLYIKDDDATCEITGISQ